MKRRKADNKYNYSIKGRYREVKRAAKARGIDFDLTISEYTWLVAGNSCFYCQTTLPKSGSGLDRLDSDLGYNVENAVPCCTECNYIKGIALSAAEMLEVAKLLKKLRKKPCKHPARKLVERLRRARC